MALPRLVRLPNGRKITIFSLGDLTPIIADAIGGDATEALLEILDERHEEAMDAIRELRERLEELERE